MEHSPDGAVTAVSTPVATAAPTSGTRPRSSLAVMAAHEWRLLRADRMLRVVGLLFGALLIAALINGVNWTRFQAATLAELRSADSTRFAQYADTLKSMGPDAPVAGPFAPDPRESDDDRPHGAERWRRWIRTALGAGCGPERPAAILPEGEHRRTAGCAQGR
ncbi:MAG: hypothetical protein U5K74_14350 [Gemmatimonadaceae bacterium]|nr:hypothetical protein [Gemmatimonadaceae bacterium]